MARAKPKPTAERAARPITDVKLPAELELVRFDLANAANNLANDDPKDWPETEPATTLLRAYAPEEIARILIKAYHPSIRKCQIAYLWKEEMSDGPTRVKLGHAAKAGAQIKFLAEVDFILTFNHAAWKVLSIEQKIALVDHELEHCDVDSEGRHGIIPHNIEEFNAIVRRWGLWKPDLQSFGDCVLASLQIDLFDHSKDAGAAGTPAVATPDGEDPPPPKAKDVTPLRQHE